MDVLILEPPYKALKGIGTESGYSLSTICLAAYLQHGGIDANVLNCNLLIDLPMQPAMTFDVKAYALGQDKYLDALTDEDHEMWNNLKDAISLYHPKIVAITYITPAKAVVEKVLSLIKNLNRRITTIVGGHHATFCAEEVISDANVDYVVIGEGETPLLQLTQSILHKKGAVDSIPGIVYRANDKIIKTPKAGLIKRLDALPYPARRSVLNCNFDRYSAHYIYTARGCPYSCSFCSDKALWGGAIRRRSVDNVISEIKHLIQNFNVAFIDIADGTFTFDKTYVVEFCRRLINEKLEVKWRCTARYDNIDKELLCLMKEANCGGLYFGLESGSERILKSMNKKTTINDIIEGSKLVYESRIGSVTAVLLGMPDETAEDIEQTLALMRKIRTDLFDINNYVPLPGSPLYKHLSEKTIETIDWGKTAFKSFDNYFSDKLTKKELNNYVNIAYEIAADALARFKNRGGWRSEKKT